MPKWKTDTIGEACKNLCWCSSLTKGAVPWMKITECKMVHTLAKNYLQINKWLEIIKLYYRDNKIKQKHNFCVFSRYSLKHYQKHASPISFLIINGIKPVSKAEKNNVRMNKRKVSDIRTDMKSIQIWSCCIFQKTQSLYLSWYLICNSLVHCHTWVVSVNMFTSTIYQFMYQFYPVRLTSSAVKHDVTT
jgi:hypothetical protein